MSDKLVFDLAQEVEGSPNVFIRKDWLNILDNQNQNYNNNQSVLDTSQLSNSNKYMSYREAYFSIPFLVTIANTGNPTLGTLAPNPAYFSPATTTGSSDYAFGLKNWFGQIIHSFTLDYNGTTIVQQTPFVNMWNSFKLMTSLSLNDIKMQGPTIGFYPDDALTWQYADPIISTQTGAGPPPTYAASAGAQPFGHGVCNNSNYDTTTIVFGANNNFKSGGGNEGFLARQQLINFDLQGLVGSSVVSNTYAPVNVAYGNLIQGGLGTCQTNASGNAQAAYGTMNNLWKSYITTKVNQANNVKGVLQYSIVSTVYLKHVHSFFNMCPLLKGVFMKMTMNLNNTSTSFVVTSSAPLNAAGGSSGALADVSSILCTNISNPLGGVNPLMIASGSPISPLPTAANPLPLTAANGGAGLAGILSANVTTAGTQTNNFVANISVGATCLDTTIVSTAGVTQGSMSKSVYLYIPAYTFNPVFEQAYLSSPVKQIKYTDIYQYQVLGVQNGGMINNLLTNGIANVKSVLVLPFYSAATGNAIVNGVSVPNSGFIAGVPVWQSPFDPAGTGPTSPLSWITNFNIQVSGQNAIYNLEKYNFEQFNNQLYGQNAVNGGLTDGLTSGLVNRQDFDMEYCYYYVNVERMLPVEQSVPKSIQLIGQNMSSKAMDYICFIEYGVEISIDALTGARV